MISGKRFLWLTENYPPQRGGMSQSCDRIVDGFRSSGATVDLFHFFNGNSSVSVPAAAGIYVPLQIFESEAHTINLAWNKINSGVQYDYIVSFGSHLTMIAAPVFTKWLDTPLITMIRGNDFDSAIFSPRKRLLISDLIETSDLVFTVSDEKKHKIKALWPEANVEFVANGIELGEWRASGTEHLFAQEWRSRHLTGNQLCIGVFGDLKPKKGLSFLLDSLGKTAIKNNLHLLIIGNVSEALQEQLSRYEFTYSLEIFQDRYQLLKYYLCLDALAIPSFYDGMPNVLLEAGALGIPVIASEVDGMKDVIVHQKDGLLFQAGNEEECRRIFYDFRKLKADARQTLGEQLQQKIQSKYSEAHEISNYKKYFNLYFTVSDRL